MQIMLSYNQASAILGSLHALSMVSEPISTKALYNISFSRRKIEQFANEIGKLNSQPSEAYRTFAVAREAVARAHALRDASGAPVIVNANYQIDPAKSEDFQAALNVVNTEHGGPRLNEQEIARQKAYHAGLDVPMPVEIRPVAMEDLPERLPAGVMDGLMALLSGAENPYSVEGGVEDPPAAKAAPTARRTRAAGKQ